MPATVYLGTSDFAAAVLAHLAASAHRPTLVITRPDAPRGRGRKLAPPPVAELAAELGLPVIQPPSVNAPEVLDAVRDAGAQAACVCAYGALIKDPLLSAFPILNVHPSLLPRWRGAAPVERAIMAGDAETGVSIMRLTAGLDSGPVCLQERHQIGPDDDYGTLVPPLEELGSRLLIEALDNPPEWIEQDEAGVTYAEKIVAEDRRLDPGGASATELDRRVRALSPHIGAFLESDAMGRLGVWRTRVADGDGPRFIPCASGTLELLEVQPAGKRRMDAADWARGQGR